MSNKIDFLNNTNTFYKTQNQSELLFKGNTPQAKNMIQRMICKKQNRFEIERAENEGWYIPT